jgi:hypothetical protein
MERSDVAWVLEAEAFPDSHSEIRRAVEQAGHEVVSWSDDWWGSGRWPRFSECPVVFHGSLGNAARIVETLPWRPGAFCRTEAFHCSSWYPHAERWLLHRKWRVLAANALVADPGALEPFGNPDAIFVRPDSPLKPFSGRIVARAQLSLKALDHGFYYDDPDLPVVIAPVQTIGQEWRYVVVEGRVVAGSTYAADRKGRASDSADTASWRFAVDVVATLTPPEDVYVLDVCVADGGLRVLELNPFSGADLYGCDLAAVVSAVTQSVRKATKINGSNA